MCRSNFIILSVIISIFFFCGDKDNIDINIPDLEAELHTFKYVELLNNRDFENGDTTLTSWGIVNQFACGRDSTCAYSGKWSVKIFRSNNISFSWFFQRVEIFPLGKEITLSSYIKTESLADGSAQIIVAINDSEGYQINYENSLYIYKIDGTKPWKKYSIKIYVPIDACEIYVYLLNDGIGTVWFDKVSLSYIE